MYIDECNHHRYEISSPKWRDTMVACIYLMMDYRLDCNEFTMFERLIVIPVLQEWSYAH